MFLLRSLSPWLIALSALGGAAAVAQPLPTITVFAAASLKESLDAVAAQFEKKASVNIRRSYGASSALARQIEKGAPADLFISADLEWMNYVAQRQLIRAASRSHLLSNRLVLIAPAASQVTLPITPNFPLAAALGENRLALADPTSVPAGRYAKAALQALGVWSAVERKLAPAESVRAALALVARGETPLGIVYATDAIAERKVRVMGEFSMALHPPIVYAAAVLVDSRAHSAEALLRFMHSAEARLVWQKYGFLVDH